MARPRTDIVKRALARILKTDSCWLWQGSISGNGYGQIGGYVGGEMKNVNAHRLIFETLIKKVPKGMHLDHLCRNTLCVNPDHLEIVTPKENTLRGVGPAAINAKKVGCKNGHTYTNQSLYIDPRGKRECRICRVAAASRFRLGVQIG